MQTFFLFHPHEVTIDLRCVCCICLCHCERPCVQINLSNIWCVPWHLSPIAHVMSHFQREVGGQLRNLPFWPELHCNWSKKRQKWVVSNPQPLLLWPELRMPISYHKWVVSFSTFPPKSPFWVRQLKRGAGCLIWSPLIYTWNQKSLVDSMGSLQIVKKKLFY